MKWGFISLCLVICVEAQLNLGQDSQPVSGLVEAQLDESQPRGRRIVRAPQHPEHPRATQRQKGSQRTQRPQRTRQTQRRKGLPRPTLRTRHAQRAHVLQRAQHAQRTPRTQHVQGSLRSLSAQRAHHAQRSQRVQRAQNSQRTTPQRPHRPQRARHQRPQSAQRAQHTPRAQSPQRSKLQQRPQRQRAHVPKRPQSPKHTQRSQRPKRPQSPRRPTQRPQRQPNKQRNRGNRPGQNRNKNGGARRAKRSKKVDVVKDLKLMQKGPRPSRKVWRRKVRRFCRRFPGHPKCRRGRMPKYSELGSMLQLLKGKKSRLLPRVPRMRIRDPLARVDRKLARELARFKIKLGKVDEPTARKLRDRCRRFKCKEKKKEHIEEKELVAAKILEFEQSQFGEEKDTREEIELRLDRTQQLKETLLEKANLSDVVDPADNGVFDSDLLLTADQANFLLNDLGKAGEGADEIPLPTDFDDDDDETPAERRKREDRRKRAALFFEENVVKKWDMNAPIQYYLDNSLSTQDKNDVRGAVSDIQRSSCIRFQEVRSAPTGYHIHYYKVNSPTFCGLSYVGRNSPANPIYLSFQCGNARGVAIHETLHALGVAHQHLRFDRDQHLNVDWSNINPQMYDSFVVLDSKLYTSYGVKYDFGSIMHYNAYTAAIDISKPTMSPKYDYANNLRKEGQRSAMSQADIELLNKMYCMPGCEDTNVYCGAWALRNLCNVEQHRGWMVQNCKKSCNFCSWG